MISFFRGVSCIECQRYISGRVLEVIVYWICQFYLMWWFRLVVTNFTRLVPVVLAVNCHLKKVFFNSFGFNAFLFTNSGTEIYMQGNEIWHPNCEHYLTTENIAVNCYYKMLYFFPWKVSKSPAKGTKFQHTIWATFNLYVNISYSFKKISLNKGICCQRRNKLF